MHPVINTLHNILLLSVNLVTSRDIITRIIILEIEIMLERKYGNFLLALNMVVAFSKVWG